MTKTFKFRIYPNKKQIKVLNKTLEICRMTYNDLLSKRIKEYKTTGKTLSYYDQCKDVTKQKNIYDGIKFVNIHILQNVAMRVDLAFQNFFRRLKNKTEKPGFPRFKQFNRYDSLTFNGSIDIVRLVDDSERIFLSRKIGYIKIVKHRKIEGVIKTCTIKRFSTGKWFVTIVCRNMSNQELEKTGKSVGIDLGLSKFATLSDGTKIKNPRFLKKEQKQLAKSQRKLAKLEVKTAPYLKQKKVIARIHERIKNKRDNFTHQKSRKTINKYDIICVEDLTVNCMKEEGKYPTINRSIQDVAWRNFIGQLVYKAEEAGRQVIQINPAYTSQTCNNCLSRRKMLLSNRIFKCDSCGHKENRDLNAAKNILRIGLDSLTGRNSSIEA